MPCFVTLTASHSKVLSSMENADIMLKTAAKCSKYAKNYGLCFSFWIMLFEADYAKNYASIMYQRLSPTAVAARCPSLSYRPNRRRLPRRTPTIDTKASENTRTGDIPIPKYMLKWEKSCKKALRIVKKLSRLPLTCCSSAVSSPIFMIDPSFESSSCTLIIERRHALAALRVFAREFVQGDEADACRQREQTVT